MLLEVEESEVRLMGYALQVAITAVAHAKDKTADGEELSQEQRVGLMHQMRTLESKLADELDSSK